MQYKIRQATEKPMKVMGLVNPSQFNGVWFGGTAAVISLLTVRVVLQQKP